MLHLVYTGSHYHAPKQEAAMAITQQTEVAFSEEKPESLELAWHLFVEDLRKAGARITTARKIVFHDVMTRGDHFRADELAVALASGKNRVSRGTVYRTLALMVEKGFVRTIRDGDTHLHYERIYGRKHHEHMVCESCGDFIEFEAAALTREIEKQCQGLGFAERTHRLTVFGICRDCQAQGKRDASREKA